MPSTTRRSPKPALLNTTMLSHGTLECSDLHVTRRFYEEVFGLEVIQHAPNAMMIRLGGDHTYVVIETSRHQREMPLMNHNGLDVDSEDAVRAAYEALVAIKDEYGIRRILKPVLQHGSFSFYLQDLDGNWWEISHLPPGGYSSRFGDAQWDLTGREDPGDESARV